MYTIFELTELFSEFKSNEKLKFISPVQLLYIEEDKIVLKKTVFEWKDVISELVLYCDGLFNKKYRIFKRFLENNIITFNDKSIEPKKIVTDTPTGEKFIRISDSNTI